ncbi:MAG: ribonuclease HII [Mycobacteriales bacterium]
MSPVGRHRPLDWHERALARCGFGLVAGADEAGRGACAGPLVAAACILPAGRRGRIPALTDSKQLSPSVRSRVYDIVVQRAVALAVVEISAREVDRLGLQAANLSALRRAIAGLHPNPDFALVDGFSVPGIGVPGLGVWKGDQVVACVAAASVLAKVTRDRLMQELNVRWPGYGFGGHKGYCTREHDAALATLGPCPIHRRSYAPVRAALARGPVGENGRMAVWA